MGLLGRSVKLPICLLQQSTDKIITATSIWFNRIAERRPVEINLAVFTFSKGDSATVSTYLSFHPMSYQSLQKWHWLYLPVGRKSSANDLGGLSGKSFALLLQSTVRKLYCFVKRSQQQNWSASLVGSPGLQQSLRFSRYTNLEVRKSWRFQPSHSKLVSDSKYLVSSRFLKFSYPPFFFRDIGVIGTIKQEVTSSVWWPRPCILSMTSWRSRCFHIRFDWLKSSVWWSMATMLRLLTSDRMVFKMGDGGFEIAEILQTLYCM